MLGYNNNCNSIHDTGLDIQVKVALLLTISRACVGVGMVSKRPLGWIPVAARRVAVSLLGPLCVLIWGLFNAQISSFGFSSWIPGRRN